MLDVTYGKLSDCLSCYFAFVALLTSCYCIVGIVAVKVA